MKHNESNIWIGEEDLTRSESFVERSQQEFPQQEKNLMEKLGEEEVASQLGGGRRDFLKMMGFGLGAATIAAGCDIPVKRALPYVTKPDAIVPGVATYYASSFVKGGDYAPILVKTREGRPIKIEGNDMSSMIKGGTSPNVQAYVLDLYDTNRIKKAKKGGKEAWSTVSWSDLDKEVMAALSNAGSIGIVSNSIISPSAKRAIADFQAKYPNTTHVSYDPVSYTGMLDANESSFGQRVIPNYKFDKADVIVSFGADFLGSWISGTEYAQAYAKNRVLNSLDNPKMSRHIQVESHMSLTGSNADNRILVKPSHQGAAIAYLHSEIVGGGNSTGLDAGVKRNLDKVASELRSATGRSLVVSGSNNKAEQMMVNNINASLNNVGATLNFDHVSYQRQGDDKALSDMVRRMKSGGVDVVILWDCNPVYDSCERGQFADAMSKVSTKVAMVYNPSESTDLCTHVAPIHHGLESWGDVEAKRGMYGLTQPTIAPLFETRQAELSLLTWAEALADMSNADQPYMEYVKKHWQETLFTQQTKYASFQAFWDSSLRDGVLEMSVDNLALSMNVSVEGQITKPSTSEIEIGFFETQAQGNGQYAGNPWLMEMPDPVARTSWGNYLSVPVNFDGVNKFNALNGLKDGDLVKLTVSGQEVTVPVIQQFGQMPGTVALALGYGRTMAGPVGTNVGVDVNDMLTKSNGETSYYSTSVSLSNKIGKEDHFSCVQYHHTMGVKGEDKKTGEVINADEAATVDFGYGLVDQGFQGSLTERSIIYQSNLKKLKGTVEAMQKNRAHAEHLNQETLYPYDEYTEQFYSQGHHWGMHVDMNACIGCSACTVACMSENNVPVVGKKEVARHHEMTWLRIDRYYYGDHKNPNVVYQPMMCQHCDNAPCENVCPVNATNHSSEGLNQMAYNRCIGTRYCANNCPFKVRRFNWLDYTTADIFPANQVKLASEGDVPYGADNLTRMVLNPDVTVRSRGVIEKCSFCVQRIQEGKLTAKAEGRRLRDADVKTACQTSCPTGAITFGDMNNKSGDLSKKLDSPLNYIVLEEVNVRSSVNYSMKVNNRDTSYDA